MKRSAFTLIELLVVISIIVLLLSMLAPAMERAFQAARNAACLANIHTISIASASYLNDSKRIFPAFASYYVLMGNPGVHNATDVRDRPYNAYLGFTNNGTKVGSVICPCDQGDSLENPILGSITSYEKWGTSYLPAWYHNPISRVEAVFGSTAHGTASATASNFQRTSNKVILADWPWYGNRHYNVKVNQWHIKDNIDRRFSTLFADGHGDLFLFDRDDVEDGKATDGYGNPANLFAVPANPGFRWW